MMTAYQFSCSSVRSSLVMQNGKGGLSMKMNQWYLYEQEEDNTDRFHRHVMEWVEILGLLLSLVWGVVGLVFFIQLMETLGGLF